MPYAASNWQEEAALARYQLIAPLLDESLDPAARSQLRKDIATRNQISDRTLRRYEQAYRESGFAGLKPADRQQQQSSLLPDNYRDLLDQMIQLKRELPTRSVHQIIRIMEMEGRVEPGVLKRSTVERHLYKAGFSVRQMKMYNESQKSSSKRFCKPHRMMLLQTDFKFGPKLPIGKNGAKVQTYLCSLIDDHSRYIVHSEYYTTQDTESVEDCLRKAILKAGRCDAIYMDNGSPFISKQLSMSLAKLGIRCKRAPVRSGQSKGKVEKYHQIVDKYQREARLKGIKTLEELNRYWTIYLDELYQNDSQGGIEEYYKSIGKPVPEEGISPLQEWNRDTRPLVFYDVETIAQAFTHHEKRLVDKGACISFRNRKYETKPSLIGCQVEISYDPSVPDVLTVSYEGIEPFQARPVQIGEYCSKTPAIPLSMQAEKPTTSRLLDAAEKVHEQKLNTRTDAISFGKFKKGE
ncbi:MAG: DDE-type integrase/transposase/recombinase [Clostridiales bacterium]|nr:DDE-type integrase/transposase/recombinase [Clostridiales bacterium]